MTDVKGAKSLVGDTIVWIHARSTDEHEPHYREPLLGVGGVFLRCDVLPFLTVSRGEAGTNSGSGARDQHRR
jgi:hypothetical protein